MAARILSLVASSALAAYPSRRSIFSSLTLAACRAAARRAAAAFCAVAAATSRRFLSTSSDRRSPVNSWNRRRTAEGTSATFTLGLRFSRFPLKVTPGGV